MFMFFMFFQIIKLLIKSQIFIKLNNNISFSIIINKKKYIYSLTMYTLI